MNREAINKLLIATGLALLFLLLTIGVVSPLHAATPPPLPAPQDTDEVRLEIASTPPTTVTLGQNVTLTTKIYNGGSITITDLNLSLTLPPWAESDTTQSTRQWGFLTPTQAVTHSTLFSVPKRGMPQVLSFWTTLRYMISDTEKFTTSYTQVVIQSVDALSSTPISPLPSPLPSPSIPPSTDTPEPSPSPGKPTQSRSPLTSPTPRSSPSPTISPTFTPPPSPTISSTPPSTPSPTRSPLDVAIEAFTNNWPMAGIVCLVPLLILSLLLILLRGRKKKPTAPPSTPGPPGPAVLGPHLESMGLSGGPQRFTLKPEGFSIGRGMENDLVITQDFPAWETVSHHHARIYRQIGQWMIEDLNSMNGVYVNERRTGRNLLHDGWQLGIGGVQFVFHTGTGEAQQ